MYDWVLRHKLGLGMWVVFVVSVFLMVKSSSDELPASLRGTMAEIVLSQFRTGNQIVFDVTVGVIVSLFIYLLVVYLPERSKRARVRTNLRLHYNGFKEESIRIFLSAAQGSYGPELVERLKERDQFRNFFKERVSPDQERWHAVLNGLDEDKIKSLVVELEILMAEIHFTLTTIDIDNPAAFMLLKRLAGVLYRSRNWSSDYDSVRQLAGFMWSMHTGWSFIDGYAERDVVADTIEAI